MHTEQKKPRTPAQKPWDSLNWKHIGYRVRKLQKRIAKAAAEKNWKKVRTLQNLVYHSRDCRLMAVHRVTSRKTKRTPGIDNKFWHTDNERYTAAEKINPKTHTFSPLKRVYIPKDHNKTKLRPLSIPTIEDRAIQTLILIALDPVIETGADRHAYGYRKHRSAQNAIEDILTTFRLDTQNPWILKTDIKECFESISHQWLIDHPPIEKEILKKAISPGYIYKNKYHKTEIGLARGGIISPALTTHILTGIEPALKTNNPDIKFVRYVDDILIAGKNKQTIETAKETLQTFLNQRGLTLSEEKTAITHIKNGIDYIGWHIQKTETGLTAHPSEKFKEELIIRLQNIIQQGAHWSREKLIQKLNSSISGWGLYHAYGTNQSSYLDLDEKLQNLLWTWAEKRHPKQTKKWIYQHYWKYNTETKKREFSSDTTHLKHFTETEINQIKSRDLSKNPYIDIEYFRAQEKEKHTLQKHTSQQRNW